MKAGRPSSSAEAVALARALESSRSEGDRLFQDALAQSALSRSRWGLFQLLRSPVLGPLLLDLTDRLAPGVRGFPVARTRYIDDALIASLREGIDQVVILGAGYDSRAYRIAGIERARVFEVDHPDTQARKRALIDRILGRAPKHVCFVPIDFNRQGLGEALLMAGCSESRRAFFIWEGVTEYLSERAVDATLRYVADATEGDSRIVFTYMDRGVLSGTKHFPGASALVASSRLGSEPYTFGLEPSTLRRYLSERGFELIEDVAGAEFETRYFKPLGRRLRANEFQRTALARVPGSRGGRRPT